MEDPSAEQVARDGTGKAADADKENIGRAAQLELMVSRLRVLPSRAS
jgi:hypothetical protein